MSKEISFEKQLENAEKAYAKLMTEGKQPELPKEELYIGRLVKVKKSSWWNSNGLMDHYDGKVVQINKLFNSSNKFEIKSQHPTEIQIWSFLKSDIVDWNPIEPEYRPGELKKMIVPNRTCAPDLENISGERDMTKTEIPISSTDIIIPKIVKKKENVVISLDIQSYPVTIPTVKRIK